MKEHHTFKIHAPVDARTAFVEMDGKRIIGVTNVVVEVYPNKPTKITLGIIGSVNADGFGEIG